MKLATFIARDRERVGFVLEDHVYGLPETQQAVADLRIGGPQPEFLNSGAFPDTMEGLLALPGVARKTANVVLGTWFGENAGVVVDTHVGRLAGRMGLTWRARNDKDAVRIEADLMELLPRQGWTYFSHAMIRHGRLTCTAVSPGCASCPLAGLCPSAGTFD